ncbi:MAG: M23 family metallopeptidase [Bacillus sp. (in: Bacteria)]|nr:M23 family metallopeptidase [Bacillus sp. (in: firmicutes)]MCM1427854.1 M23 family metallopeptidase [Eubacterium sp.]
MENVKQLGKDIAASAQKKAEVQSENYQLSNSNTEQNLNGKKLEELAYNAIDHHMTYQKTQYSYNEKMNEYAAPAFNDYDYEKSASSGDEPQQPPPSREQLPLLPDKSREASLPTPLTQQGGGLLNGTAEAYNGINLGSAEAGELAANSYKLSKTEDLINKLDDKRKYAQRGYTRITLKVGDKELSTKSRLLFNYYGRIRLSEDKTELMKIGRVRYEEQVVREKRNRKDYNDRLNKKEQKKFRRGAAGRLLFNKGHSLVNDESMEEDENIASYKNALKRAGRITLMSARNNVRTFRLNHNIYTRLEMANMKNQVLLNERERLLSRDRKKSQQDKIRQAQTAKQKQELKKKMYRQRAEKEGNFFRRTKNQFMVKKSAREYRRKAVKRTLSVAFSFAGICLFIILLLVILLLVVVSVTQGGTTYYAATVTQNDYGTVSEATAYFRKLETDLDEYLNADREALEAELETEYGPDIYEYIYNLADFGFSANTLIAYLSAVYAEFTLEEIQDELQDIFQEMYKLIIEVKMEDREIVKYNPDTGEYYTVTEPKKICYVTLEKKELEEVVEARLSEDLKSQYDGYKLSTGGQQVYAPVMREDWTNLISSNYGERIHPITKVRTFHKGVDIAVPEGTKLYSAVKGVVTVSQYSESAGNYVTVKTDSGWTVTFMHMNARAVSVGQELEQGDFVGLSGNTGNSTGAHLHLQVANEEGETVNPIFIIPQTCAFIKGDAQQEVQ